MTALTIFTTFIEKNYILFAIQKDEAGVVCQPFMLNFLTSSGVYIKLGSHLHIMMVIIIKCTLMLCVL